MKTNFIKLCALGLGALTFFGCQEDEDAVFEAVNTQKAYADNCDVINFSQYPTGFITEVHSNKGMGPVKLMNKARNSGGTMVEENRAMIFDMANPTGDDTDDLFHTALGKGLIINHLGTTIPNDNQWGGTMELDFSAIGPVSISNVTVVDIDDNDDITKIENDSYIRLLDGNGVELQKYMLKPGENGNVQIAALNQDNVMKMEVMLAGTNGFVGSGAIDDIEFCVMPKDEPEPEVGCTRTQGYWKTHADASKAKKYDNTWDPYVNATFYKSNMTYLQVLNESTKGMAYFILAHQYIAAMLNMEAGASMPDDVQEAFDAATEYFEDSTPVKKDPMHNELTSWASVLDNYNNGVTGPGHCE